MTLKSSRAEISQSPILNTRNSALCELLHWYLVILILTESTFICVTFIFLDARPRSWRKQLVGSKDVENQPGLCLRFHLQAVTLPCRICKSANSEGIVQSFTLGFQTLQNSLLFSSLCMRGTHLNASLSVAPPALSPHAPSYFSRCPWCLWSICEQNSPVV